MTGLYIFPRERGQHLLRNPEPERTILVKMLLQLRVPSSQQHIVLGIKNLGCHALPAQHRLVSARRMLRGVQVSGAIEDRDECSHVRPSIRREQLPLSLRSEQQD